jgi:amino-acid N-acetyltransferase
MSTLEPTPATDADLLEVYSLLERVNLPTAGVAQGFPTNYVVIRDGAQLTGVAGLETYGRYALLRSLAVAPQHRSTGLGRKLVDDRLRAARSKGSRAVYLLTTTAADFFCRLGFERLTRDDAPFEVRTCEEFASICPASAVCLFRNVA